MCIRDRTQFIRNTPFRINTLTYVPGTEGTLIGKGNRQSSIGEIAISYDFGETWQATNEFKTLGSMQFLSPTVGYATNYRLDRQAGDPFIFKWSGNLSSDESINDFSNQIRLSPNPVSDLLQINLPNSLSGNVELRIFNQLGKLIRTEQIEATSRPQLDVTSLP